MRILKNKSERPSDLTVARRLHPEDIGIGDHLAILLVSHEFPSSLWCGVDVTRLPPEQTVRLTFLPYEEFECLKVKSVCLPFVLCKSCRNRHKVIDVRQVQLAKLDPAFARAVRKHASSGSAGLKNKTGNSRRKKRRKKRD